MIIISKIALGYCNAVILLAILLLHDENVASALLISNHQGREHGHLFPRSLGRCHATNNQEILVLPNVQPGARYDSFDGHSGQFSYHELPSSEHGFCQQVLYRENKFGKKFIGSQIFKQTKIKRVESTPRKLRGEFLTLEWVKGMIYALMVCTLIFMPFSSIESSASAIEKFTTVSSSFIGTVEDGTELGKKSNLAFKSTVETDVSLPTILRPGLPKGYFKAATKVPSESFPPGKADPTAPTPPHPPVAITTSQRYWDAQNSNNVDSIIESNMKLLDHAVGTIVNMYYDNSGGSQFAQQDLYDNWKLLKSRASTTVMNHESTRDDGQRRNDNSNAERNNRDNKGIGTGNEVVTSKATRTLHRKATPTAILSEGEIHRIITAKHLTEPPQSTFSSRESAVQGLRWLVVSRFASLNFTFVCKNRLTI